MAIYIQDTYWIVEEWDGAHKEFFSPIKHRFYWPLINYPPLVHGSTQILEEFCLNCEQYVC